MSAEKQPFVVELERIFGILNRQIFGNRLALPTITIQSEKKVVFRFVPESNQIIVGARFATSSFSSIANHLLHEMVHIANYSVGIIDCTSNQYHNKRFLSAALEVGFYVVRHKTQGWGVTKFDLAAADVSEASVPTAVALNRRRKVFSNLTIDKTVIRLLQRRMVRRIEAKSSRKVCFLKYVCACPEPHNSIRSGRRPDSDHPLRIRCLICRSEFILAEGQEKGIVNAGRVGRVAK